MRALRPILPGVIVPWCGFNSAVKTDQRPGVVVAMRLCEILLPGLLLAVAILLLRLYPLSVGGMVEIRRELEARRGSL